MTRSVARGQHDGVTRRALGIGSLAAAAASVAPTRAQAAPPPASASGSASTKARVQAIIPALEDYVSKGLELWQVPGAAVGVVVGDDVVYARGFGLRDLSASAPVDANTVFGIGSATKAFAAATEAIMVDRGKMRWTDKVLDHDPAFRLHDPWVTREFEILDLLAQRSGMRPYVLDPMWALGYSADEMVAALRHARPVSSFRTTFAYQNILHLVAGGIVARQAGAKSWGDALKTLLLEPLGMKDTSSTTAALVGAPNRAVGHAMMNGKLQPFDPPPTFDAVGPAGAMNASVTDMLKWLRLQTGRGSFEGKRIVSEENLTETWRPRVEIPGVPGFPVNSAAYASGWIFQLSANGRFIWHNGGTGLIKAHVGFIPDQRVGFVMLTNEGANALHDATGLWFYDRVLGNPEVDYSTQYRGKLDDARRAAEAAIRRPDPPTSPGALGDYAGHYRSPVLKAATIAVAGGSLRLTLEATRYPLILRPWNGEAFSLDSEDRLIAVSLVSDGPTLVQFQREPSGKVSELRFIGNEELTLTRTT